MDHDRVEDDFPRARDENSGWQAGYKSPPGPYDSPVDEDRNDYNEPYYTSPIRVPPQQRGGFMGEERSPPGPYDSPYASPPGPYDSPHHSDEEDGSRRNKR